MNKIEEIIDNTNIKLTTARETILEILVKANKPLSYEDMKNTELLSMDKATFYRNISKFEEENIVTSFESNDKKRYFEIQQNPHAHFICTSCNKIECMDDFSSLQKTGYKIDTVILKGLCPNCL